MCVTSGRSDYCTRLYDVKSIKLFLSWKMGKHFLDFTKGRICRMRQQLSAAQGTLYSVFFFVVKYSTFKWMYLEKSHERVLFSIVPKSNNFCRVMFNAWTGRASQINSWFPYFIIQLIFHFCKLTLCELHADSLWHKWWGGRNSRA